MFMNNNYLEYLQRHRKYVLEECIALGVESRGLVHDLSKYEPDEFYAYAAYFYGGHDRDHIPPEIQEEFDYAWLRHQKRNDHHWQYWVLTEDSGISTALQMPELAAREMLADWRGADRAILGDKANIYLWYENNRNRMLLHPNTRKWIEANL